MRLRADPRIEGACDLALSVGPGIEPGEGFLFEPMAIILIRELSPTSPPEFATAVQTIFDLTPAEARLASALSSGRSLEGAAVASGITVKSARTYLERIFRKTGTHQQSQLVALLKSVHPFPAH